MECRSIVSVNTQDPSNTHYAVTVIKINYNYEGLHG